jgi:hypothetical protein
LLTIVIEIFIFRSNLNEIPSSEDNRPWQHN